MKIVYIGRKPLKTDNVAETGLTWAPGEIHEVLDEKKCASLLEHTEIWVDADKPYQQQSEPEKVEYKPEPKVLLVPQGGEDVSPYWDPITIPVPGEVFKKLQSHELTAVFMTTADADMFERWKHGVDAGIGGGNSEDSDKTVTPPVKQKRAYNRKAA